MSRAAKNKKDARWKVRNAINAGKLVRPDRCQECSAPNKPASNGRSTIEAHHHKGYDYPLDVQWLCCKCHKARDYCPSGEDQGSAKLTWKDVREIRRRYISRPMGRPPKTFGMQPNSLPSLALEFGVNISTIHRIVQKVTWRSNEQL